MREPQALKLLAAVVLASFASGCASSTVIRSKPTGATVYLNGEKMGKTPYTMTDIKVIGTTTTVRLVREGCADLTAAITRSEELDTAPVLLGFCSLFPWLWAMKYTPEHLYELDCR